MDTDKTALFSPRDGMPSESNDHSMENSNRDALETLPHYGVVEGKLLEVRCPSCHTTISIPPSSTLADLKCSSCGSKINLVDQKSSVRDAPSYSMLGRFELIDQVGVGAFGAVWRARDRELDRTVAIKVPRKSAIPPAEAEKFFREARTAAQLRHPNIVSVYEVGRDGDSVYIVSDFIHGGTLADWLAKRQPHFRESAELCATIASALHHAHEQGVVHRDLKPANIMMDASGQPHITDFGLARRDYGEVTMTLEGQVIGTPAYMSPEQAQGESHQADRRSDVYSVGVILFQLLTGELPFRGNVRMLLQQVLWDEPPSPRKLNGNVPKDLETITLKCLEKSPEKRYQSADELAVELRRFLLGEPILARPVSRPERAFRWMRRNKMVSALTAAVFLTMLGGTIVSTILAIHANSQTSLALQREREADSYFRQSESVVDFLIKAFKSPDPDRDGRTITVAEVFDQAEELLDTSLEKEPATQAAILHAIGSSRMGLGMRREAVETLEKANELVEPSRRDKFEFLKTLGVAYSHVGKMDEAVRSLEESRDLLIQARGENALETLQVQDALANIYWNAGRRDDAFKLYEETLKKLRATVGEEHPATLTLLFNLGGACLQADRVEEGLKYSEKVWAANKRLHGDDHPSTLDAMSNVAGAYYYLNRDEEAIPIFEQVLEGRRKALGPNHPDTLDVLMNLAAVYKEVGKEQEALQMFEAAVKDRDEAPGAESPRMLTAMQNLAAFYDELDRTVESIPLMEQVLAGRRRILNADHPDTKSALSELTQYQKNVGKFAEAIELWKEEAIRLEEAHGPKDRETLAALTSLAGTYHDAGKVPDAIKLLEEVLPEQDASVGPEDPDTMKSVQFLAICYRSAERLSKALPLYERLVDWSRKKYGPDNKETILSENTLAITYQALDRKDDAIPLLVKNGHYYQATELAGNATLAQLKVLTESAIARELITLIEPPQVVICGQLRLLGGDAKGAEEAFRMLKKKYGPAPDFNLGLGLALLDQDRKEESDKAFREIARAYIGDDDSFNLDGAHLIAVSAAYFLDLITEEQFVDKMKDDEVFACSPWFDIGMRREYAGDIAGAKTAYEKVLEMAGDTPGNHIPGFARWRLDKLNQAKADQPMPPVN